MAQLKDLIVTGAARVIGPIYGTLKGNADSATKATNDGGGNNIANTYATKAVASASANGLMSSGDKAKLDGVDNGANKYVHPSYTARASGLYKFVVDAFGHVSDVVAVTKADIVALGIPSQDTNTTYGVATGSANGLMSAEDKNKLDGLAAKKVYGPFTVAASSWAVDGSRYKATIAVSGISADDIANVYFSADSVDSNDLKPYCATAAGSVSIYAEAKPTAAVTVDKIVV